jgi:hypothetical protein
MIERQGTVAKACIIHNSTFLTAVLLNIFIVIVCLKTLPSTEKNSINILFIITNIPDMHYTSGS